MPNIFGEPYPDEVTMDPTAPAQQAANAAAVRARAKAMNDAMLARRAAGRTPFDEALSALEAALPPVARPDQERNAAAVRGRANGMEFPVRPGVLEPEHKQAARTATDLAKQAKRETHLTMSEAQQQIEEQRKRIALEAQRAAHDALTAHEDTQRNLRAQVEKEFQRADEMAKARKQKEALQKQKGQTATVAADTQSKKATANAAAMEAERRATPTTAVHDTVAGVENTGNLASPGAFARGTYDTDGAGAGSAILSAAQALGGAEPTLAAQAPGQNSVDVGGQRFNAPPTINTREFSYSPQYVRTSTGFMGLPTPSYSSRSQDNVLSAGDVANLRQRQVEHAGATFQSMMEEYGGRGVDAGQLQRLSTALATGDLMGAAAASRGLPPSLTQQAKMSAIAADNIRREAAFADLQKTQFELSRAMQITPLSLAGLDYGDGGGSSAGSGGSGVSIGSLTNLLTATTGKGKPDQPNELGFYAIQDQFLRLSNGRAVPWLESTDKEGIGTGDTLKVKEMRSTGYLAKLVQRANAQDIEAAKALEEVGGFRAIRKGNGEIQIVADYTNPNGFKGAQYVLDYVNGAALTTAKARAQGVEWTDPLAAENPDEFVEQPTVAPVGKAQTAVQSRKQKWEAAKQRVADLRVIAHAQSIGSPEWTRAQEAVQKAQLQAEKLVVYPWEELVGRRADRQAESIAEARKRLGQ